MSDKKPWADEPARDPQGRTPVSDQDVEWATGLAVQYADALIAELEKQG
jgi:hypothetical protein